MTRDTVASKQSSRPKDQEICRSRQGQRLLKRLLDVIISSLLLVVIWPLWLLIALWIVWDSPGPVLFRQTRVGLGGKQYGIFKFRTMFDNADAQMQAKLAGLQKIDDFVFQQKDDPRVTRSGRFLRKSSLDELPQLINILLGNMSIVGPRPEVPEIVKLYTPEQSRRLSVPPGVTGLAQVNGRSELTLGQTLDYDLEYVNKWNLGLDLKIIWETVLVVFSGKGAY
ncbi:MAG: sugar transferase [Desulfitobacteriaceae bacterium]|nr:sugar transferase [Desulfitobacteriaceae bacterium]MDD4345912.1 sugar transferase [Desulfitobacteriaceae bacterium]MDD4401020.1 sugar transferase [Desulfitobacteriaceae bacterium]